MTEAEAGLLNGEKLLIRMVDTNYDHLAASAIDHDNWPTDLATHSTQHKAYWLYVPPERLRHI
jgi:hypothetical protein